MHTIALKIPRHIDVFSDEELYEFCRQNPDLRIERDEHGQIYLKMPTGTKTSILNSRLNGELYIWNKQHRLGEVTDADGGYILPDTSMRVPDVAWISRQRLASVAEDELKKFAPVCPDFVIELRSESDTLAELQDKMEKWLRNGVRLGWLIDPKGENTHVYRAGQPAAALGFDEPLSGEDVLPGFSLRLRDIAG